MNVSRQRLLHASVVALSLAMCGCAFHAPDVEFRAGDPVATQVGEVLAKVPDARKLDARGSVVHIELRKAAHGLWPLPADSLRVFRSDGGFERTIKPTVSASDVAGDETARRFVIEFADDAFTAGDAGESLTRRIAFTSESSILPRVFVLTVRRGTLDVHAEPGVAEEPAGAFARATYFLWGLPRDLLDAPFTSLNRCGIGTFFTTEGCEKHDENAMGSKAVVGLSALTGVVVGSVYGVHHAGAHYAKTMLYSSGGTIVGGLAGAGIGAAAVGAYGVGVIPAQTALLRSGFDDEYVKGDRARLVIDKEWTDATVAAWQRHERSLAYFPNWRFGVCGELRTLPGADARVKTTTVVKSIELQEIDPASR